MCLHIKQIYHQICSLTILCRYLFRQYYYKLYEHLGQQAKFRLLNIWDSNGVFFVVRHKENLQYRIVKEMDLLANRHQHILKDEVIELKNTKYPKRLRRVAVWNEEKQTAAAYQTTE